MIQRVIADCNICGLDCEECEGKWKLWDLNGKCCQIDTDDKECVDGASKVYNACTHGAIKFKRIR